MLSPFKMQITNKRTVNELTAIAQASVDYYISQGLWPAGISQLAPQFMAQAVTSSPFGQVIKLLVSITW